MQRSPWFLLVLLVCLVLSSGCMQRGGGGNGGDDDSTAEDDDDSVGDVDPGDDDGAPTTWLFEGEGPEVQHDCGSVDGGAWVACDGHCEGGADHLIFGPYVELPAGGYQVTWRLKTDDADRSSLRIIQLDVTTNQGSIHLAEHRVDRSEFSAAHAWREFSLNFGHDGSSSLEFRVQYIDSHQPCVWIDWIRVDRLD